MTNNGTPPPTHAKFILVGGPMQGQVRSLPIPMLQMVRIPNPAKLVLARSTSDPDAHQAPKFETYYAMNARILAACTEIKSMVYRHESVQDQATFDPLYRKAIAAYVLDDKHFTPGAGHGDDPTPA